MHPPSFKKSGELYSAILLVRPNSNIMGVLYGGLLLLEDLFVKFGYQIIVIKGGLKTTGFNIFFQQLGNDSYPKCFHGYEMVTVFPWQPVYCDVLKFV